MSKSQAQVTFRLPPNRAALREHVRVLMNVGGVDRPTTFCYHPKLDTYKVQVLGLGGQIVYIAKNPDTKKWTAAICEKGGPRTFSPASKTVVASSPKQAFLEILPKVEEIVADTYQDEESDD